MGNPRRTNGSLRDKVRSRVLREEDDCWLCHLPVDKTLPPYLPGSPEVDEVIPVSKGGSPYDRSNCRLSHRRCNRQRGNGDRKVAAVKPLGTARAWTHPA